MERRAGQRSDVTLSLLQHECYAAGPFYIGQNILVLLELNLLKRKHVKQEDTGNTEKVDWNALEIVRIQTVSGQFHCI